MTIEIHEPEIEALIRERVLSGAYRDAADVVAKALRSSDGSRPLGAVATPRTGADILAVFQASPHKDLDIEPSRPHLPVREFSW
jgi:Arc/MetJ-type ribon-helix-helix transcriptional regulator